MSKPLRLLLVVGLPGFLVLLGLTHPRIVLEVIVLPAATVAWLVLRIFVLSIDQVVYWWGLIALAVFGAVGFLLRGSASRAVLHVVAASPAWDPSRRWRESIMLNAWSPPQRDSFRRDVAWLLATLYASPRPGGAKYQVREALQEGRIPLPGSVHDFLFASTRPRDPAPSFFRNPAAAVREAARSFSESLNTARRRRRRSADYVRSAEEVLAFMETQLEMTHELDSDA